MFYHMDYYKQKKIKQGVIYIVLNTIGAILVIVSLINDWNAPSFVTQVIWIFFSIIGLYLIFKENKKFDTIYLVFDNTTKEIPTHFLLFLKGKLVEAIEYNNKKIWKMINSKDITLIKDEFFSIKIKIPMYETPPPRRGDISHYEKKFKIVRNDNTYVYTI